MRAAAGIVLLLVWTRADAAPPPASQPTTAPAPQPASQPASTAAAAPAPAPAGPLPPDTAGLDRSGTPTLPPTDEALPPRSAPPGQRRSPQDFDGRPEPRPTAGDVLIWVPRGLLMPAHLLMEYVVRRPLVGLITFVEEHHIQQWVRKLFVFRGGKAGIFPTALYEFGIDPSLGFYLYYDDMFVPGHNAVLRGGFWTDDWVKLELNDQVVVFADDTGLVTTDLLYLRRPDRPFHGLGAATTQDDETFYRVEQVEARVGLSGKLGQLNRTTLQLAYRHTSFEDGQSPPISERFATAEVPGFGGYDLVSTRLGLELDSRGPDRRYSTGSGLRLELFGSFNVDPTEIDLNFFHWGAEAAGFLDLTGANHVLGLRAYAHFVENTGDLAVPFTEQAELGGRRLMRGFLEGRFRGPSAFVVTGEYRYPIWALVDASLFISAGNAFDEHLKDLHVKKLFLSGGLGIRTNTRRNLSFDALLAFGSSRLDQEDVTLEHVHFVFGVNSGF